MKVRLMVTEDCKKNCSYCCNKQDWVKETCNDISLLDLFKMNYKELLITGGEPMLFAEKLKGLAITHKTIKPNVPIYLYTAQYYTKLAEIIPYIDGVHFTLHSGSTNNDFYFFENFVDNIVSKYYKNKSFRLYISNDIHYRIEFKPIWFKRIEMCKWKKECPLPAGEQLFKLKPSWKLKDEN